MRQRQTRRRGFQMVDLAISLTIFFVVVGSFTRAISSVQSEVSSSSARTSLARAGNRALRAIVDDIRYSGFATVAGNDFPHVFTNGDAAAPFDAHDHAVPVVVPDSPSDAIVAAGPGAIVSREAIFLLPSDANGAGPPDLDANGQARWGNAEVSYVLVPDGTSNRIERRVDGVQDETIARNVSALFIDTPASSGFVVPLGCMRVRITLTSFNDDGQRLDHAVESVVRLRNGDL